MVVPTGLKTVKYIVSKHTILAIIPTDISAKNSPETPQKRL